MVCVDLVDLFSLPAAVWLDEKFDDLGAPILETLHAVDVIVEADEHVEVVHAALRDQGLIKTVLHIDQYLLVGLDDQAVRVPRAFNYRRLSDEVCLLDVLDLADQLIFEYHVLHLDLNERCIVVACHQERVRPEEPEHANLALRVLGQETDPRVDTAPIPPHERHEAKTAQVDDVKGHVGVVG